MRALFLVLLAAVLAIGPPAFATALALQETSLLSTASPAELLFGVALLFVVALTVAIRDRRQRRSSLGELFEAVEGLVSRKEVKPMSGFYRG